MAQEWHPILRGKCRMTAAEMELAHQITLRMKSLGFVAAGYAKQTAMMDIELVHRTLGLRLKEWLEGPDLDFAHDVAMLRDNLNRETGKMEGICSMRYSKVVKGEVVETVKAKVAKKFPKLAGKVEVI